MAESKIVDTYGRNSFIIEIDGRKYRRSRVYLRKATGDLDKAECNMHLNEIIPFSHEEAREATSEEKGRESDVASSSSAETMIKDEVIVEEEEIVTNATNSWDTGTSYATGRNPQRKESHQVFCLNTMSYISFFILQEGGCSWICYVSVFI